jgi:hypothetical protein
VEAGTGRKEAQKDTKRIPVSPVSLLFVDFCRLFSYLAVAALRSIRPRFGGMKQIRENLTRQGRTLLTATALSSALNYDSLTVAA